MEKTNCIKFNKYKKFKNPKISYIINKTSFLSIICDKCGSNDDRIFKEK